MDCSGLIASIAIALDKLHYWREKSVSHSDEIKLEIMMRGLRVVRTFLLCSTKLMGDSNGILCPQNQMLMQQVNSRMRKDLGSLLVEVEVVIRKILDDHIPYEPYHFRYDMESCEEEMDSWYTSLSDSLEKYSTSPVAGQIKVITDSVLENLKDYLSSKRSYGHELKEQLQQIQTLKKDITYMGSFIYFGTLLCVENQEFQCLLSQFEPLAISAAHLTLHLFSNIRGPMHIPNAVTGSMLSALLLNINPVSNPLLHEKYTRAMASLKHSRESCDPTLDLNDYPFIMKMEHCIVSLISSLWEMPQLVSRVSLKELQLYERLKILRTLVKRQPDRFDDDKIRDLTRAVVFDAGVRILSLWQNDLVIDPKIQCFQDESEVVWAEVLEEKVVETSRFKFSKNNNLLGFLDFLLEDYLIEMKSSNVDSNTLGCVPKIREHLVFLKSFIGKLAELRNQQENLYQDVWNLSVEVAYKMEFLIDQLVLGDILDSFSMIFQSISKDMMFVKAESLNVFNDLGRMEIKTQQLTWSSADEVRSISSNLVADEVIGFESEQASIINRLMRGMKKLQAVAIVGMPGLGKTTLATKVFNDPSITHHFLVKAWCSISQEFDRRKVLLELLNQIIIKLPDKYLTMNTDDLSQELWRSLRKRRYLIFFDDIWDIEAFNYLRESLPDDSYQSRILFTSRHSGAVPSDFLDDKPLFLQHLHVDKSLELLQKKLFPAQVCWPPALNVLGMEIAEYCKGLPLTIVIIAGLLKSTEQEGWKDVLKTLRSNVISNVRDEYESIIELSYKHLPGYLKPCFLWFGAFSEDHIFSVKKLIWLWIAEGLVRKSVGKSLEDVAADYLKNLIGRSLVMNVKERTIGGVKACRIHDLLHEFCLKKAHEENFMHLFKVKGNGKQEYLSSNDFEASSFGELRNTRRLFLYSEPVHFKSKVFCPCLRSLLFFHPTSWDKKHDLSFIFGTLKLLRVLDVDQVEYPELSTEIGGLSQLRYLAIRVDNIVSPALGNLSNLETLILDGVKGPPPSLPNTLWNLRKLRHLYSKHLLIVLPADNPADNPDSSCNLPELETLSTLYIRDWSLMEKQLRKFPKIRQMKCGLLNKDGFDSKVADFSFLSQLESLSLSNYGSELIELIFPENIKKLTLCRVKFPCNEIPSIAKLPYLEVLKLIQCSFLGDTWHVEEEGFPKLRFLKLRSPNLINWTAASDDLFPNLEKLVLESCYVLKEIPECLENVTTLETIEVIGCTYVVVSLFKKVEEFQKEMGNSVIQFHEH